MAVHINPNKSKHLVVLWREDLASASALMAVNDVSVWADGYGCMLTDMFTVCHSAVYCLSTAFECTSVYPPLTNRTFVWCNTTGHKEGSFFIVISHSAVYRSSFLDVSARADKLQSVSDGTFDVSLSHVACASVDAFAHMLCWREVLMWSLMAGIKIVGSVSWTACSHWIKAAQWREGLCRRHTWCPSSSSSHGWVELQRCSPSYAYPEINLLILAGKSNLLWLWPKGNRLLRHV